MKVKVIEDFRDKYTNEIHTKNKKIEVTEERYKELKGYVEKIEKNNKTGKKSK